MSYKFPKNRLNKKKTRALAAACERPQGRPLACGRSGASQGFATLAFASSCSSCTDRRSRSERRAVALVEAMR